MASETAKNEDNYQSAAVICSTEMLLRTYLIINIKQLHMNLFKILFSRVNFQDMIFKKIVNYHFSCMALMAKSWTLLKRFAMWKPADLDCILQRGDDLLRN